MKKSVFFGALCGLLLGLTACEPQGQALPESYPKKHLLEEFTGQDCGYCPYGMDCVHDFIKNDTNWIVVLHHYGYAADHFSVAGSKKITNKLAVSGAPTVCIDRAKTKTGGGTSICFHPGYLPETSRTQFETTTYASIELENRYDSATRMLTVRVSGAVLRKDAPELKLTLLVKESGMVDYQADNYATYEGWQEFRHCNAVRAYLTDPLGDAITINKKQYVAEYDLVLEKKWKANNCAVVAILSEDFKPVVQAEQKPVVAGTQGGADILHGGITPVPVEDYYPEPGTDISPSTYSGLEADTLTTATGYYTDYAQQGFRLWQIQGYNANQTMTIGKTTCIPFINLLLFTETGSKTIPAGTYPINSSKKVGSVLAGYRNDEKMEINGTMYYYISKSYFSQGYLVPSAQWLIVDGEMTVSDEGWELTGHVRNGNDIHLVGTSAIKAGGAMKAPARTAEQEADAPQHIISIR